MLRKVKTIFNRLNTNPGDGIATPWPRGQSPASEDGGTEDDPATDSTDTASPPHLFKCPSCEQVYVATDKRKCSTCAIAVDRVE